MQEKLDCILKVNRVINAQRNKSRHTNFRVNLTVGECQVSDALEYLKTNYDDFNWRITEWNNGAVIWAYTFWFSKENEKDQFLLWHKLTYVPAS